VFLDIVISFACDDAQVFAELVSFFLPDGDGEDKEKGIGSILLQSYRHCCALCARRISLSLSWFHICRPPSLVSAAPKVHFSAELLPFLAWQCGGKHCPEIQNLLISFAYGSVTCFGLQGLSEAVWHMTIQQQQQPLPPPQDGGMDHPAGQQGQFPERLGEPDCVYYMRTGMCGFGQSCRFNHPPNRKLAAAVARGKGDYPERFGQPECQVLDPLLF
jgi:hypothetical protein